MCGGNIYILHFLCKLDVSQKQCMKESEFIEQNKQKWVDFENNLSKKDVSPEKTSKLFVQITDDLSYARTFYKNRSVKNYLNGVAKLLFNDINKSKKNRFDAFIQFWKRDLPLTMYVSRRPMLISLIVFIACFILGVVTSIYDPEFARTILSNDYVNMTNENIANGDAMAVYKSDGEMETFLRIFLNNIRVDFMTFFAGIFMSIGTLLIMVVNGVMVGVFQFFFIQKGLFWESFLGIWTHGALEISTIIISGGAGLVLGKGLLFPGTYSRFQAFRISGMNGLKIIMGVAPVTLLAAFIEGFLTRHTDIPDVLRFLFILMSFAFIFIYFVWYPRKVAKQFENPEEETDIKPIYQPNVVFDPNQVLETGTIITETLRLFFKSFSFVGVLTLSCSLLFALVLATDSLNLFILDNTYNFAFIHFFNYIEFPALAILSTLCFVVILVLGLLFIKKQLLAKDSGAILKSPSFLNTAYASFLSIPIFVGLIAIDNGWFIFLAFLLFPLLILMTTISTHQNVSFFKAINLIGGLLNRRWGILLLVSLFFFGLSTLLYLATMGALNVLFLENALVWMLTDDDQIAQKISLGVAIFQLVFSFFTYLVLTLIASSVMYYTLKESYTAENLLGRIKAIKSNK